MKKNACLKVGDFLRTLASKSAIPGGGSVCALTGACAAGLVSMVCHLTLGKKGYEDVQEDIKKALVSSVRMRKLLTVLIDEDADAYSVVIDAYKTRNKIYIDASLKQAVLVPLHTAILSKKILLLTEEVIQKGNKRAISDARCARALAVASIEGALENVKINLDSISDNGFKKRIRKIMKDLISDKNSGWL